MASLSVDSLYHVSAYLNHRDLSNFCLVNRRCHEFSRKHLYRTITISFSSSETLNSAVDQWSCILQRTQSFQHVQHVKVLPSDPYQDPIAGVLTDCGDNWREPWRYCWSLGREQKTIEQDSEWQDLSCLIKKLPALKALTWGCSEQIPASILRYVNQTRPNLRLHMRNFMLRCLFQLSAGPVVLDPYEVELATSPCLYSLTKTYDYHHRGHNQAAIMDLLAGAAPNLQEINMTWQDDSYLRDSQTPQGPMYRYQPGTLPGSSPSRLGRLKSLNLFANGSSSVIRRWSSITDFQCLESLEVVYLMDDDTLFWLASCRLSALKHVSFSVDFGESNTDGLEAASMFIQSLDSLTSLKLKGPLNLRTLLPTFDTCGHRLRRLLLATSELQPGVEKLASVDLILALRERCPRLEELALSIMRSHGDQSEVAIYKALGTLRYLTKIHLAVYYPQPIPLPRAYYLRNKFEDYCTNGKVTDEQIHLTLDNAITNSAFDPTLAQSIFRTISKSKAEFSYPLERLSLRVQKVDTYPPLRDLLAYIGRSWVCTRNERDDRPHECFVSEYDDAEYKIDREYIEVHNEYPKLKNAVIAQAIYRIWPAAERGNWIEEWRSLPLADP